MEQSQGRGHLHFLEELSFVDVKLLTSPLANFSRRLLHFQL
jgi:hypothetical protein